MTLDDLKTNNPDIEFFSVRDEEFKKYGKFLDFDATKIISICENIPKPETGSKYLASVPELEDIDCSDDIKNIVGGGLNAQIGLCWGYNNSLNALEYHKCSEVNIAVTPLVLLLGHIYDIKENKLDSKSVKAFYLEKGDTVEIYSTSLHFCPCQVSDNGFYCLVGLLKGTNTPLESKLNDRLLFAKNKWLICHEDNTALIDRGVYAGIFGKNYTINY